jgi:RNA polymerase sigma factor (sigma-70 family)
MRTDGELLRSGPGDVTAFAELVGRHQAALGRYATRRLGPTQAEDIVNETFAIAYAKRDGYDRSRPDARPWLFGIATNLIRRHARAEARMLQAYARTGIDPVAPDGPARTAMDPAVAAGLAAIRPKHRDVLFLHAVAELSHEEIAEALDIPVGTARGWLSRARKAAAKELTARGITPRVQAHDEPEAAAT